MIAPGIEPNPPITVTISPLVVSGSDNSGDSTPMAAPHGAGDAADHACDHEGQTVDARDRNSAQLRRGGLLRDRARRDAELGAVEQPQQQQHRQAAESEHEHQIAAQGERSGIDDHVGKQRGIGHRDTHRRMHDDLVDQEQRADR